MNSDLNTNYPLDFRDVLDPSMPTNFVESFLFLQVYFICENHDLSMLSMRNKSFLLYKVQIGNLEEANVYVHF